MAFMHTRGNAPELDGCTQMRVPIRDGAEGLCSESFYLRLFLRAFIECWKPEETARVEALPSLPG